MNDWQDASDAPRDGSWIIIRNEHGTGRLARWEPKTFRIGDQWLTYEWRVWDDDDWNWWDEYQADDWQPLPASCDERPQGQDAVERLGSDRTASAVDGEAGQTP